MSVNKHVLEMATIVASPENMGYNQEAFLIGLVLFPAILWGTDDVEHITIDSALPEEFVRDVLDGYERTGYCPLIDVLRDQDHNTWIDIGAFLIYDVALGLTYPDEERSMVLALINIVLEGGMP